ALLNSVMNSRRLMPNLEVSPALVLQFASDGTSAVHPPLFDHLVGAGEKRFRNGQSERLGSLEVYDQLEFVRQLNRRVRGTSTIENKIDIRCGAPEQVRRVVAERYQASALREVAVAVNRGEVVSDR